MALGLEMVDREIVPMLGDFVIVMDEGSGGVVLVKTGMEIVGVFQNAPVAFHVARALSPTEGAVYLKRNDAPIHHFNPENYG